MSLTNPSQVLLRNPELLIANAPLFINMPEDGFIDAYLKFNSQANISCYNTNYDEYTSLIAAHKSKCPKVNTLFASTYQSEIKHDLVILYFPKCKAELAFTLATIAPYLAEECKVLLVGEKKGGIQSAPKLSQHFLTHCQKIDTARHCWLFAGIVQNEQLSKIFTLNDWFVKYDLTINNITLTVASLPGVFSQQKLDRGTELLLKNLPTPINGKTLDFGCGAGVISCFIGKKNPGSILYLVDVSALALTSAEKTLSLNTLQGTVYPSDSLYHLNDRYQYIVSNPPFHQGINTDYQTTESFLSGIKDHLHKNGLITIVANSFLRYQPIMQQHIGHTKTLDKAQGFSIYQSQCR